MNWNRNALGSLRNGKTKEMKKGVGPKKRQEFPHQWDHSNKNITTHSMGKQWLDGDPYPRKTNSIIMDFLPHFLA
jgi:hypothetical protein